MKLTFLTESRACKTVIKTFVFFLSRLVGSAIENIVTFARWDHSRSILNVNIVRGIMLLCENNLETNQPTYFYFVCHFTVIIKHIHGYFL